MVYSYGALMIESDYEIRILKEDEVTKDMDIFIDLSNRSMNLFFQELERAVISRIQLPLVRGILLRFCKKNNCEIATVHLLRNIDLQSHLLNFEVCYVKKILSIKNNIDVVEFSLKNQ